MSYHQIGISVGILIAFLIPFTFPEKISEDNGYIGLYIVGGPIVFFFIQLIAQTIWFDYDTPKYYLFSNQKEKVFQLITRII